MEFSALYKDGYQIEVINTKGTTWSGAVINTTTGKRTHIGSWTLPAGTQGIKGSQVGFVEYYLWNDGKNHPCSTLPYTKIVFGVPTTSTSGAIGSLGDAYEYGNCVGKVAFKSKRTSDKGDKVSVGFY